mgnify:CR=1
RARSSPFERWIYACCDLRCCQCRVVWAGVVRAASVSRVHSNVHSLLFMW